MKLSRWRDEESISSVDENVLYQNFQDKNIVDSWREISYNNIYT